MDELDQYLDLVCRGIAGPRSLRLHIRRELAEHLRDAAAEHQASGMSPEDALKRTLEDFGGPDQLRAELEAQHGHRLMTVVLDKALQWKEKTMKAKWLWSTWAHAMLLLVIALELGFLYGCVILIVPKFRDYAQQGWFDFAGPTGDVAAMINWATSVVANVAAACHNGLWILLLTAAVWALFESRVRSDNKTLIRLSAMGTAAVALALAAFLTGAALILPLIIAVGAPHHVEAAHRIAAAHTVTLDQALKSMDAAIAAKDWDQTHTQLDHAYHELNTIIFTGLGQPMWESSDAPNGVNSLFHDVTQALLDARSACELRDQTKFDAAMKNFREAYSRLRPATTQPAPK